MLNNTVHAKVNGIAIKKNTVGPKDYFTQGFNEKMQCPNKALQEISTIPFRAYSTNYSLVIEVTPSRPLRLG